MTMFRRLLAAMALLLSAGCCFGDGYLCRPDEAEFDCKFENDGKGAICLYDGRYGTYCAFPNRDCSSGYRWSSSSWKVSCECVDPNLLNQDGGSGVDQ